MEQRVRLTAADGHTFDAYRAVPGAGKPRGAIVVVQEIFGVTAHVERVTREFAALGFAAIAPALFDRVRPGIVLDYTDIETGRGVMQQLAWPNTLADVTAALDAVRDAGRTGIVGYCWGGTVVHVAGSELALDAGVSYYGTGVLRNLDKRPRCPTMYHFGEQDHSIPAAEIDKVKAAVPDAYFHVYAGAQHGFNCEDRASFSASDARLAFARTALFLREHLG